MELKGGAMGGVMGGAKEEGLGSRLELSKPLYRLT